LNIENIASNDENRLLTTEKITLSEEESLMRLNKNIRKRKDGRFEWRKMILGTSHFLINSNLKELVKMVAEYKKSQLKPVVKQKEQKKKESRKVIDLAWKWFRLNKEGKVKGRCYQSALKNYIFKLDRDINFYTKNDIIEFLNTITAHRTRDCCHIILNNTFAEATESGITKRNVILTLKNPKGKTEKGLWFNPEEQKLIYENRHKCSVGHEIEFFIMIGCRLSEAFNCRLELDKLRIWVERTKEHETSGYVNISKKYAEHLNKHWSKMFKLNKDCYAREFGVLLNSLGIKRQKNEKPIHRLRHTFATNIYYFGVNDKKRSYLLGHKTTEMTNDTYTDFNIDIRKEDITSIYGELYPEF